MLPQEALPEIVIPPLKEFPALRVQLEQQERPSHLGSRTALALGTAALFAWSMRDLGPVTLAVLVGVLLFHEAGHFVAMRFFGYRDLWVFFVPFLGAAVAGRPVDPASWKAGVVSLAGPVPGLLIGAALVPWASREPRSVATATVFLLVAINGFNLLPLIPLDGGRLLGSILFSRHPALEVAAWCAGAIGLATQIDWSGTTAWLVPGLAFGLLINQVRILTAVRPLQREQHFDAVPTSQLPNEQLRALVMAVEEIVKQMPMASERTKLSFIRTLHERAQLRPAGARVSIALFAVWLAAGATALGAEHYYHHPSASWEPVSDPNGAWVVQLPAHPHHLEIPSSRPGTGPINVTVAYLNGAGGFSILTVEINRAAPIFEGSEAGVRDILTKMSEEASQEVSAVHTERSEMRLAGRIALDTRYTLQGGGVLEMIHTGVGRQVVVLKMGDVTDTGIARKFIDSFTLL